MHGQRTQVTISANNIKVWYDPASSHAATHIQDTPTLLGLAQEVITQTTVTGPYMQFHIDLGRTVGTTDLVETRPADEIVYAKRKNRDSYTVFNKTQPAQPCSIVTLALENQEDGTYELVSTWIGPSDSPSFPGTQRETSESKEFWSKHALAGEAKRFSQEAKQYTALGSDFGILLVWIQKVGT